ncbi:uncharacterized protein LOC111863863 isoform X1 [Cryptotermes secundus]|nr:uncharacterized protein LOC111863863 isoform X1 [Cryptotermes secundus]XP_023706386.1 uncharacterized protein LOC111863863 isoform X1 [Cryptotermes secundus]XP_033607121.1 uncharacterized protein LOC111863863 isoform X1 [Cryptotermes secundus]XP_033607122.1 uncharacterized protein LOC111863863 isoform X1 [Cryptotermes secundus]XP_033607123.1 uncharacterized protein LOC111863863 isoform X1 [Cryptotermes secundus]XP_033607124.1 uncharacterized protein LOC111863863 isoform X1 [Cryptotermes sec
MVGESTMRIANLRTLIAVLSLAAILFPRSTTQNNESSSVNHPGNSKDHLYVARDGGENSFFNEDRESRQLTNREMQLLLRLEGGDEGHPVDCCPSVEEMVEPEGGRNKDDMYVVLFRNGDIRQRFYEYSCKESVVGKPCRFLNRRLHNQSRCVQKFSYSYAIVRNPGASTSSAEFGSGEPQRHHYHRHRPSHLPALPLTTSTPNSFGGSEWMLDYIRVRSGCGCEVMPKPKKKHSAANKGKKTKSTKLYSEDDLQT